MIVVYIAGPFRAKSHWSVHKNIRNAEGLALQVWALGCAAICPHANTLHFQDALPDDFWLAGDIEIMLRSDAVLMVPGWEASEGAKIEHETALEKGIPIFYSIAELGTYMGLQPSETENRIRQIK